MRATAWPWRPFSRSSRLRPRHPTRRFRIRCSACSRSSRRTRRRARLRSGPMRTPRCASRSSSCSRTGRSRTRTRRRTARRFTVCRARPRCSRRGPNAPIWRSPTASWRWRSRSTRSAPACSPRPTAWWRRGGWVSCSTSSYLGHTDARVRWQAVKLQVTLPAQRDAALANGLQDPDPRTLRLALGLAVALQRCPDDAVEALVDRTTDGTSPVDVRSLAIRALGYARPPAALDALLRLASGGRSLFGREKLRAKSPEVLAALMALATGWGRHPRARAVLERAAAANDHEIRAAARQAERGPA